MIGSEIIRYSLRGFNVHEISRLPERKEEVTGNKSCGTLNSRRAYNSDTPQALILCKWGIAVYIH